jgi:hypothetical protein
MIIIININKYASLYIRCALVCSFVRNHKPWYLFKSSMSTIILLFVETPRKFITAKLSMD